MDLKFSDVFSAMKFKLDVVDVEGSQNMSSMEVNCLLEGKNGLITE